MIFNRKKKGPRNPRSESEWNSFLAPYYDIIGWKDEAEVKRLLSREMRDIIIRFHKVDIVDDRVLAAEISQEIGQKLSSLRNTKMGEYLVNLYDGICVEYCIK